MEFSVLCFELRRHFEGCKLEAYQDQAGVWTIGIGTTFYPNGMRVAEGDTCTADEANEYAAHAMADIARVFNGTLPAGLTQGQYDALGDFAYNAGMGAFNGSTLKKLVAAGASADSEAITNAFCAWDKAHVDGELVTVPGLLRRRKCEAYLFINGVNHPTFFE